MKTLDHRPPPTARAGSGRHPDPSRPEREVEERRLRSVRRVVLVAFGAGPCLGSIGAGLLVLAGSRLSDSLGVGVLILALTWGFLGSIAWLTARGIEATEQVVLEMKQLRAAKSTPAHGQLSLGAEAGRVSPTDRTGCPGDAGATPDCPG